MVKRQHLDLDLNEEYVDKFVRVANSGDIVSVVLEKSTVELPSSVYPSIRACKFRRGEIVGILRVDDSKNPFRLRRVLEGLRKPAE